MAYFEGEKKMIKIGKKGFILVWVLVLVACASKMTPKQENAATDSPSNDLQSKLITDIRTADTPESTIVSIVGNRLLTYTSVKQPMPLGIVLYFPETSLGIAKTEYQIDGSVVGTIKAAELVEKGPSKVTIALKVDAPYEIVRDGDALKISFKKSMEAAGEGPGVAGTQGVTAKEDTIGSQPPAMGQAEGEKIPVAVATEAVPEEAAAVVEAPPAAEPASKQALIAGVNALRKVSANESDDSITVSVMTDHPVSDYKSFALSNPARIVFDLYGVKSSFAKQQTVPVKSKWVKNIRYFGYPERVRIVIDTEDAYLSSFQAETVENGLAIRLGQNLTAASVAGAEKAVPESPAPKDIPKQAAMATPAVKKGKAAPRSSQEIAIVNRIDFVSMDKGESSVIVGTSKPVTYNVSKIDEKRIQLQLENTKILDYRKRPLITDRFESAIDRILPIQTSDVKNARILVELREAVPYDVEQTDTQIRINFAASTIAPKPLEEEKLPVLNKIPEQVQAAKPFAAEPPAEPTKLSSIVSTPVPVSEAVEAEKLAGLDKEAAVEIPKAEIETDVEEDIKPVEEAASSLKKPAVKRYTGEKIALDFYQTDIKNVLRILRDVSGKNFAIDQDVSGKVTLTLVKPVPWDQVLDLILKMNQLGQIPEGDIVRIVTIKTLGEEEKQKADALKAEATLKEQKKALEPIYTEYIPISYANASADIKPRLDEIKSPDRGKIGVDTRNNQIIITDTAEIISKAKNIVKQIDKVTPQVIIEARVVEVSENFSQSIGTRWGISSQRTATSAPGASDISTLSIAMNHPVSASGTIGASFSRIVGTPFSLSAELTALEVAGDGKIISAPKIVTLDNKEALIKQGLEYPYVERDSSGLATNKFKKIDLELKVTPHVTPDNRISMKMNITKNDVADLINGVPSLATNEANTELLVNDGDTIVIGGIIKGSNSSSQTRWPVLSKIPLLGWLFKNKTISEKKNELLIFVTPRIAQLEDQM